MILMTLLSFFQSLFDKSFILTFKKLNINEFILLKKNLIKNYIRSFFDFSNSYFSNYKNKLASFILSFLKVNINDLSNRD